MTTKPPPRSLTYCWVSSKNRSLSAARGMSSRKSTSVANKSLRMGVRVGSNGGLAIEPILPRANEHRAPLSLFHLRFNLQIDGQIDGLGRPDANRIKRHAQPCGRRLSAARGRRTRVIRKIAQQHHRTQARRTI